MLCIERVFQHTDSGFQREAYGHGLAKPTVISEFSLFIAQNLKLRLYLSRHATSMSKSLKSYFRKHLRRVNI